MKNYIFLVFCWGTYFYLHSLFAASSTKEIFKNILGSRFKVYRLFYSILSVAGVIGILYLNATIPSGKIINNEGIVRYFSLMLTTFGIIIIQLAFKQYNFSAFLGFKEEEGDEKLKTEGILQKVRHPIYAGTILIAAGFFLFSPNLPTLVSVLCIFIYLPIGIYIEEKKLVEKYGDEYIKYRREVPMLFPKWR